MTPAVTFDLRDEAIKTSDEMDAAMERRLEKCRKEFGEFEGVAIVLHERQAKWLKFEMYEQGKYTAEQLRKMFLRDWQGIPIVMTDSWEAMPCPNCGRIHEDE